MASQPTQGPYHILRKFRTKRIKEKKSEEKSRQGPGDAKAEGAVAAAWAGVAAIRGTDVPGAIVPRPATSDPVRACTFPG